MGSEWGTLPRVRHSEWEGRHSEHPNAAIPKSRHSERPLFRNSAIPNLTFKAICLWILHQFPTSSTSNERWESPLHHQITCSLFFFQYCIYSVRRNNVIPTGVIIPLYSVGRSSHKSEISGYWDTSKFIQERIHTIVSNVGRRLVDSGLNIVLLT